MQKDQGSCLPGYLPKPPSIRLGPFQHPPPPLTGPSAAPSDSRGVPTQGQYGPLKPQSPAWDWLGATGHAHEIANAPRRPEQANVLLFRITEKEIAREERLTRGTRPCLRTGKAVCAEANSRPDGQMGLGFGLQDEAGRMAYQQSGMRNASQTLIGHGNPGGQTQPLGRKFPEHQVRGTPDDRPQCLPNYAQRPSDGRRWDIHRHLQPTPRSPGSPSESATSSRR